MDSEFQEEVILAEEFIGDMLNRDAIIVKAKQPLFDWLNNVEPGERVLTVNDASPHVYLIDEVDDISDLEKWLKKNFQQIFLLEISSWHLLEDDYPKEITFKSFKTWFDYELDVGLTDLGKEFISAY